MTEPVVAGDPAALGFDPTRLARVDAHLARYVDDGRLPGASILVSRRGQVAHQFCCGARDIAAGLPMRTDTVVRIYSMTKPVTSVAAMMLVERGLLELTDPISKWIPAFGQARVYTGGPAARPVTVPVTEPVRVWHLLTHTAGLTYGFHRVHVVDEMYRGAGFEWGMPPDLDLAAVVDRWAGLPLLFQPGAEWNYSVATDVLGRLVEVISGQSLPDFFAEHILGPLGMVDTGFTAVDESRLAALYVRNPADGALLRYDTLGEEILRVPAAASGGGGLASTLGDYHRFTQLLLRGGELDGVRLLGPRTVRAMTGNHLPGGADLAAFGRPLYAETSYAGTGFGLGFSVLLDPAAAHSLATPGEFGWGGAASTAFWVDPVEDLTVIFLTQLLPSSTYPIRSELRSLIYQALVA
ncbi:MAG TPA: serine hydrolase domain-containing protein [Mycobacteriales bacterium]|nr:serine hydrolase domain-containing protein [Mycobacteriales bacterium]